MGPFCGFAKLITEEEEGPIPRLDPPRDSACVCPPVVYCRGRERGPLLEALRSPKGITLSKGTRKMWIGASDKWEVRVLSFKQRKWGTGIEASTARS